MFSCHRRMKYKQKLAQPAKEAKPSRMVIKKRKSVNRRVPIRASKAKRRPINRPYPKVPEKPQRTLPVLRKCTDILWFIIYILSWIVTGVFITYCIPKANLRELFSPFNLSEFSNLILIQRIKAHIVSIGMCAWFAVVLTFFLTFTLRWMSEIILAGLAMLGTVTMSCLCILFWVKSGDHQKKLDLIVACVLSTVLVMWMLFLYVVAKEIKLILYLYGESSRLVKRMPQLLVVAIVIFILEVGLVCLFMATFCTITSAVLNDNNNYVGGFIKINDAIMVIAYVVSVFMLLWTGYVISGCRVFIMAHVATLWYFQKDKNKSLGWPVMKSLLILIRYHLGTIVFGAIVLCLFETFKNIIDRCRQISEGGLCRKLFLLIITVPASFCNLFWELISSNSIYVTVIYGVGYCRGLRRAKVLINFAESLYVHMISDMVRVICVFIVFTASIFVACLTLEDAEFFDYWQVYITFLLIAFLIPVLFLSIYKNITQAIFMCLCIDLEETRGKWEKSVFLTTNLKEFIKEIKLSECDLIV